MLPSYNTIKYGVKLNSWWDIFRKISTHPEKEERSIDYYVPTKTMTIHGSIIESITYRLQTRGMLW